MNKLFENILRESDPWDEGLRAYCCYCGRPITQEMMEMNEWKDGTVNLHYGKDGDIYCGDKCWEKAKEDTPHLFERVLQEGWASNKKYMSNFWSEVESDRRAHEKKEAEEKRRAAMTQEERDEEDRIKKEEYDAYMAEVAKNDKIREEYYIRVKPLKQKSYKIIADYVLSPEFKNKIKSRVKWVMDKGIAKDDNHMWNMIRKYALELFHQNVKPDPEDEAILKEKDSYGSSYWGETAWSNYDEDVKFEYSRMTLLEKVIANIIAEETGKDLEYSSSRSSKTYKLNDKKIYDYERGIDE